MPSTPRGNNQALDKILEELISMRSKLPNGELKVIQASINELKISQETMKSDLSEMKKKLLDPENGIVVKLNQNTQYIQEKKNLEEYYEEVIDEHKELLSWKNTMTKAMWIVFTALVGILTKMMFFSGTN
jgi:hypothetical protein